MRTDKWIKSCFFLKNLPFSLRQLDQSLIIMEPEGCTHTQCSGQQFSGISGTSACACVCVYARVHVCVYARVHVVMNILTVKTSSGW